MHLAFGFVKAYTYTRNTYATCYTVSKVKGKEFLSHITQQSILVDFRAKLDVSDLRVIFDKLSSAQAEVFDGVAKFVPRSSAKADRDGEYMLLSSLDNTLRCVVGGRSISLLHKAKPNFVSDRNMLVELVSSIFVDVSLGRKVDGLHFGEVSALPMAGEQEFLSSLLKPELTHKVNAAYVSLRLLEVIGDNSCDLTVTLRDDNPSKITLWENQLAVTVETDISFHAKDEAENDLSKDTMIPLLEKMIGRVEPSIVLDRLSLHESS